MATERHMVGIADRTWQEIQRLLRALPFLGQTPSDFVHRAVKNEIERVWEMFKERLGSDPALGLRAKPGRHSPGSSGGESH